MNQLKHSITKAAAKYCTAFCVFASCGSVLAGLSVDNSSREESRVFYNAVYPASENIGMGWTGNVSNGSAGTTTAGFKDAVLLRINFFRALSGIPAGITNNTTWSTQSQAAALMMSANGSLDHTPPTSWRFYSGIGALAAGNSNLSLGTCGLEAVSSYMEDPGANNEPVGHRRWILYPQTQQMGTGDIPTTSGFYASNALWVLDANHFGDARPAVRTDFVAWPPAGYVPYPLIYPRWSFSYPGADFSNAHVSMVRNGISLPVRIDSRTEGYGENTIVFVPENLNPNAWAGPVRPTADTTTRVTVGNVLVGVSPQSFSYNVTSFDPARPGADTPSLAITGPTNPVAGVSNIYSVAPQVMATGYQWKYSRKAPYTTVTSAEINGEVVPSGYTPRDSKVKAVGNYSYHLAQPRFTKASFTLKDPLICSAYSKLTFSSQLTYATNYQTARVEVSTDGGKLWQSVWAQSGKNNAGEKGFVKRTVSLAAFAGKEIRIRFNYDLRQGSAYTQTAVGVGWYVDGIYFTNVERLLGTIATGVSPSPNFDLNPVRGQTYALQVRTQVYGAYYLGWSDVKSVKGL